MWARARRGPEHRRNSARLPSDSQAMRRRTKVDRHEGTAAGGDPLIRDAASARIEAALFCAEEPINLRRLTAFADLPHAAETQRALEILQSAYEREGSSFQIVELAGGFQLLTRPEFFAWLVRLQQSAGEAKLSAMLLETLAIVAYRQPIMRADLEAIRGVHCGDALRELMERGLIRIVGRDDSLGRPILYGTTKRFLRGFGLRDLRDLPPLDAGKF
jgi:segregation and condensation protein B